MSCSDKCARNRRVDPKALTGGHSHQGVKSWIFWQRLWLEFCSWRTLLPCSPTCADASARLIGNTGGSGRSRLRPKDLLNRDATLERLQVPIQRRVELLHHQRPERLRSPL